MTDRQTNRQRETDGLAIEYMDIGQTVWPTDTYGQTVLPKDLRTDRQDRMNKRAVKEIGGNGRSLR